MGYQVGLTEAARADLGAVVRFLAQKSPPAAQRIGHEVLDAALSLALFPRRGAPVRRRPGLRKLTHRHYLIFYQVNETAQQVEVIAALNLVQQAKQQLLGDGEKEGNSTPTPNTSLIDGVRKYALSVTELDIDLIDRINPFGEAYAILAKSMTPERLKVVMEVIAARRVSLTLDEARDRAKRALKFKQEKGRLPSLTAHDPWEKRLAEGIAFLQRKVKEGGAHG